MVTTEIAGKGLPLAIAGTGHAVPETRVASGTLDARLGLSDGTLAAATGVLERPVCASEDQIDLAVAAATLAIADAGLTAQDIDAVIGASAVPYQPLPATAPLVMARLGIAGGQAAAFDVNSTCLSFVSGVELAAGRLALGQSRAVLVVSSEIASRALPWEDQPEVAGLFGDGAGAAVLTRPNAPGPMLRASLLETYPEHYDACAIGAGGTRFDFHAGPESFAAHARFRMDGKALFRATHTHFPAFVARLLERAGWTQEDVDFVVPHQASPAALAHMVTRTGLRPAQVIDISASYGNQIAASIPTALDIARRDGRIASGARVLVLGTSAGISFGGLALEV